MLALRTAVEASSNRKTAIVGVVLGLLADRDPAPLADLAQRPGQHQALLAGLRAQPLARQPADDGQPQVIADRRARGCAGRCAGGSSPGVPRRKDRIMWSSGFQCCAGIARNGTRSDDPEQAEQHRGDARARASGCTRGPAG